MAMKTPDAREIFSFLFLISGKNLRVSVTYKIKDAILSADNYYILKIFFSQMIAYGNQQVVLTKN